MYRAGQLTLKFLVEFKIYDQIISGSDLAVVREVFSKQLEKIGKSSKVRDSGLFVGTKGGYLIADVESTSELHALLSPAMVDYCSVDIRPLMSIQDLKQLLEKQL